MSRVTICNINSTEPASASFVREVESILGRIKQRAFELFEKRGGATGNEVDDWVNAERQVVFAPPSELLETASGFEIRVAAPGLTAAQLRIGVVPNGIIVRGQVKSKEAFKEGTIHFSEFGHKELFREFLLSGRIDTALVNASLQNGVLRISASKAAEVASKPAAAQSRQSRPRTGRQKKTAVA